MVRGVCTHLSTALVLLAGSRACGQDLTAAPRLGGDDLVVHFVAGGADVQRAYLPGYPVSAERREPYVLLGASPEPTGPSHLFATSVAVEDPQTVIDLSAPGMWTQSDAEPQHIVFETVASLGGQPTLSIRKTFALKNRFDIHVEYRIENLTEQDITFGLTQQGPGGMPREDVRTDYRSLYIARQRKGRIRVRRIRAGQAENPRYEHLLANDPEQPIVWWAVANRYFAAIIVPLDAGSTERIELEAIDDSPAQPFRCRWQTGRIELAAGQSTTLRYWAYLGPQDRELFASNGQYAELAFGDLIDAHGSMCTFSLLGRGMSWLLRSLVRVSPGHNYGLAILFMVVIFRILLGPLSRYGFRKTASVQLASRRLRPKVEELKKQFGNSNEEKEALNKEVIKLYQAEGITPAAQFGGCLPLLVQIPIWAALFTAINSTIELRGAPFVLWINDLSAPDALVRFGRAYSIPILGVLSGPIGSLNVLPILMGLLSGMWQTLRKGSLDADKPKRRRSFGPLIGAGLFVLFLYNAPSGLTLYIAASTTINGIQRWRITQKLSEAMAAEDQAASQESANGQAPAAPQEPTQPPEQPPPPA
ncbi:MAG TPA: YidC/Oxa1 family insertase periplasmic-domain containing protein [Phycisphaerae bacterium]|nr:YidC/Oxa1 family insertase periplasmic-domain containing protein [Phycisphaerae bacterium]